MDRQKGEEKEEITRGRYRVRLRGEKTQRKTERETWGRHTAGKSKRGKPDGGRLTKRGDNGVENRREDGRTESERQQVR